MVSMLLLQVLMLLKFGLDGIKYNLPELKRIFIQNTTWDISVAFLIAKFA